MIPGGSETCPSPRNFFESPDGAYKEKSRPSPTGYFEVLRKRALTWKPMSPTYCPEKLRLLFWFGSASVNFGEREPNMMCTGSDTPSSTHLKRPMANCSCGVR